MQVLNSNKYRQHKYTLINRFSKTKSEGVFAMPENNFLMIWEE